MPVGNLNFVLMDTLDIYFKYDSFISESHLFNSLACLFIKYFFNFNMSDTKTVQEEILLYTIHF
jgi:hypothetical protein